MEKIKELIAVRKDMCSAQYERVCESYEELLEEVELMEKHSMWLHDIPSSSLELKEVDGPLFAQELIQQYGVDPLLVEETVGAEGTNLVMLGMGEAQCVSACAIPSICETAKLSGSALGRMTPYQFSTVINMGLKVARGNTLALVRCGKLCACHSGGKSGYAVMPISKLLETTKNGLEARFGRIELVRASNSHEYTCADWLLPDAKEELLEKYHEAVDKTRSMYDLDALVPGVAFRTSDTGTMCATAVPYFRQGLNQIRLVDGVRIKHSLRGDASPMDSYQEALADIWGLFEDYFKTLHELSKIYLKHPQEALIGLCKKLGIPKSYGEVARAELEFFESDGMVSAHDLYLAATNVVAEAMLHGASTAQLLKMEEAVAKIAKIRNWSEYDIAKVSW